MKPIRYRIKKVISNDARYFAQVKVCGMWQYIDYDGRELTIFELSHSDSRSSALERIQKYHTYKKSKTVVEYEEIDLG